MRRLFRQFSTPGGMPSHVSVPTPGSIHEGGELGYVLVARVRRGVRQPRPARRGRRRRRRGGDGPARGLVEGHPLPQPGARRRRAADPPSERLQDRRPDGARPRQRRRHRARCSRGHGYEVHLRRGRRPAARAPGASRRRWTRCYAKHPRDPGRGARAAASPERPRWPAIVLRTPKGWTGPEGRRRHAGRGHVPRAPGAAGGRAARTPSISRCSRRGCGATGPRSCSTSDGRLVADARRARARRATAAWARTRTPTAAATLVELDLPDFRDYAIAVPQPGHRARTSRRAQLGKMLRDVFTRNARHANFRLFCPDETNSNRLGDVFEVENRCFVGPRRRRRRPRLARRPRDGGAERAQLPGLARGLHADRPPRPVRHLRGVRDGVRLDDRAARQVAAGGASSCRGAKPIPSLNILLTSTCWRNDHNGFSHQGPGLIDVMLSKRGTVVAHLPAAGRELPALGGRPLPAQPELRQPDRDRQAAAAAVARHGRGDRALRARRLALGVGEQRRGRRAGRRARRAPATSRRWRSSPRPGWLRAHAPELRVRVVNVVDLMALFPPRRPPARHGRRRRSSSSSPRDKPVVFAFHGYQRADPRDRPRRARTPTRFHVRGFNEQGTTTTPFDMVVLNGMSRYHLCLEALAVHAAPRGPGSSPRPPLPGDARARTAPTSASTSRTCRRCATGSGLRRERRVERACHPRVPRRAGRRRRPPRRGWPPSRVRRSPRAAASSSR